MTAMLTAPTQRDDTDLVPILAELDDIHDAVTALAQRLTDLDGLIAQAEKRRVPGVQSAARLANQLGRSLDTYSYR